MKYHELEVTSHKNATRVGRGIAAGKGKTAGRGTKGQKSRTGSSRRPGFEGGQTPLLQHLPKLRGFNSHRVPPEVVFTDQVTVLKQKTVDNISLVEAGLISNQFVNVKLLVRGDVTKALHVKLQSASSSAIEAVEKAGGTFEKLSRVPRPASAKKLAKHAGK